MHGIVPDQMKIARGVSIFKAADKVFFFLILGLFRFSLACQIIKSSPSLTILIPLWFIIISLMFFYFSEPLFSGFLQFKGNFILCRNTMTVLL